MSEEVIAKFIEKLKKENPSIGFLVDNKDIFQIFNNMDILSLIIDKYPYHHIIDQIFFLLEDSTIESILYKYPSLNTTFYHYLKDNDERLKILNNNLDINIMNLSIINNNISLLIKCLSLGIKPTKEIYKLLIEYDLLDLMIAIGLIDKNDINYHDICIDFIKDNDKESLVLPIIFLSLKNEDINKVFNEALSWGRLEIIKFMRFYYDLHIDIEKLDNSYVLKELCAIYSC
jgi:hypothetical protein